MISDDLTWPCRILDNLPIAIVRLREDNGQPFKTYERGFPVGRLEVGDLVPYESGQLLVMHLPYALQDIFMKTAVNNTRAMSKTNGLCMKACMP